MRIEEHEKLHFSISGDSDSKYELDFVSTTFNEFEIRPIRYIYIYILYTLVRFYLSFNIMVAFSY